MFNVGCCGIWMKNPLPYWLLYVTRWVFCTNPSDRVLDIPFGLYKKYLIIQEVHQYYWYMLHLNYNGHIYILSGSSVIFDRYLPLMKVLHVDWLSRRHQFYSIPDSSGASRILSPTQIMLVLRLLCENSSWYSSVLDCICKNSCDEVLHNMSTGDGR